MEVDFLKLTEANKLIAFWCDHFGLSNRFRMDFIAEIYKDPSARFTTLNKNLKSKFKQDLKSMFYGYEVENFLIEKYSSAVYFVINRLRIKHTTTKEDCYCVGLSAIRSSIFTYQRPEKSFTTYVIDGITGFIRGFAFRQKEIRDQFKKIQQPFFENEFCDKIMEDDTDLDLKNLLRTANLLENEVFLLNLYLERSSGNKWIMDYIKKYKKKDGNKIGRGGVYSKLMVIRHKIYKAIVQIRGEVYAERFSLCANK
jgi:hypothetical protein